MRVIGLVILLVGLVLVASVAGALYGAPLLAAGIAVLFFDRYLKKRELTKPGAPRYVPVHSPGKRPVARRSAVARPEAAKAPAPARAPARGKTQARAKAASKAPVRQRDHEPALDNRFEPIFEGDESSAQFADLRSEISPAAKLSLTMLSNEGFVIRARADRVMISRYNHTEVLRSNAAIVDYVKQLGLSDE